MIRKAVEEPGFKFTDQNKDLLAVSSPNVNAGNHLVNNMKYPTIAEDFAKSFKIWKELNADIFRSARRLLRLAWQVRKSEEGTGRAGSGKVVTKSAPDGSYHQRKIQDGTGIELRNAAPFRR